MWRICFSQSKKRCMLWITNENCEGKLERQRNVNQNYSSPSNCRVTVASTVNRVEKRKKEEFTETNTRRERGGSLTTSGTNLSAGEGGRELEREMEEKRERKNEMKIRAQTDARSRRRRNVGKKTAKAKKGQRNNKEEKNQNGDNES